MNEGEIFFAPDVWMLWANNSRQPNDTKYSGNQSLKLYYNVKIDYMRVSVKNDENTHQNDDTCSRTNTVLLG